MKGPVIGVWRFAAAVRVPSRRANRRRLRSRGESLEAIRIRDATAADVPALAALHVRTWQWELRVA